MRLIGKYLKQFALLQALLHVSPELGAQNLAMHTHKGRVLSIIEGQEIDERLREHVILGDVEPCFVAHLILRMDRLRQVAEMAVSNLA